MRHDSQSWQSLTPAKKPCSKSRRLPSPSQFVARIWSNQKSSKGNSAKLKSGYRSHLARSRSSSADRFDSRFNALFTFSSVSVTEYPRLPSGFLPAPFRLPPHEKISCFRVDIDLNLYDFFEKANRNMAYQRLSKEKQTLVLMALCEGMPIRAAARMFKVGKDTIHRLICETGEAFADYMDKEFRDLSCARIEMDEQWQYVGAHAGRLPKDDQTERGDYWLWACIDADTNLFSLIRSGSAIGLAVMISLATCALVFAGRCKSRPTICGPIRSISARTSDTKDTATEPRQRFSASRNCLTERWHEPGRASAEW
jgi:hypothetical protein